VAARGHAAGTGADTASAAEPDDREDRR
jgi:hypothetical protein